MTTRLPAARPTARWIARSFVLLLASLASLASLAASSPAAAAPRGAETGLPVAVSLTSVSPTALTPDTDLVVSGTVRNTGTTTVGSPQVVLRLDWRAVTDRRELADWANLGPRDPANGTRQDIG